MMRKNVNLEKNLEELRQQLRKYVEKFRINEFSMDILVRKLNRLKLDYLYQIYVMKKVFYVMNLKNVLMFHVEQLFPMDNHSLQK